MTDTFNYLFGGWKSAEARRWMNPDGSTGGIVATSAKLDRSLVVPSGATIWPDARIGYGASIGYRASIGDGDWWLTSGPHGGNRRFVTAVHSKAHGLRWWVGCQHGITTQRFIKRIAQDHCPGGEYDDVAAEYHHLIACVESHPVYLKRIAEVTP